jgi:beta-glucuronidase
MCTLRPKNSWPTQRARAGLALAAVLVLVGTAPVAAPGASPAVAPASASAAAPGPGPPAPVSLDGTWQRLPDPGLVGSARGWQTGAGGGWTPAPVPGVFDARPLAQLFHGTVIWYRLTFAGPSAPAGFSWALRFEQVRRTARVWLNGRELGSHDDPYTDFTLPATGLQAGRPNTLVVRVDNRKGAEPREGWWNWGGIVRPVELVPQGPVTLTNPALLPQVTCSAPERCTAAVLFDGWLTNATTAPVTPRVAVTLAPPGGGAGVPTTRATVAVAAPIAPGQSVHVRRAIGVAGRPELWEPGHPSLYAATLQTYAGPSLSQSDSLEVGLRSVTVRDGGLYLNDRPVQLSGASIEEDVPGRGPALTSADMDAVVSQLQAIHTNITRAQYPLSSELMSRLDRAGILLWAQAPIYHRDELLLTPAERSAALGTLRGTILADRIHPSVITYSVANELSPTPDAMPGTRGYLDAAAALSAQLDPTLPASLDLLSYPGYPRQSTYDRFALLGINNYFGWYPGRAPHATGDPAGLVPYLQTMHRLYPRQAMVMTEFGAEATTHGPATQKQTFEFQSRYVRSTLAAVRALPFMSGAIYWTLREFAVKPDWIGGAPAGTPGLLHDSIHHKGLLTYAGQPKPAWGVIRAAFAATPLFAPLPAPAARPGALPSARPAVRAPAVRVAPAVRGTPWGSLSILLAALLALAGLVAVDVRMFLRIRQAARDDDWTAPVVPLRREQREAERTYA